MTALTRCYDVDCPWTAVDDPRRGPAVNATLTQVTWGNHEADLAHADVLAREKEYEGVWINTNMPSHESVAGSKCQTDVAWIDLGAKKVAMVGLRAARKGRVDAAATTWIVSD